MDEEKVFYDDVQTCLDGFLSRVPVAATWLGDHRFDNALGAFTEDSLEERRQWARHWRRHFESADVDGWSDKAQIDRTMMVHVTLRMLRMLERVRMEYRNPITPVEMGINGLFLISQRTNAPLEERMANIHGRMSELPRYLREARSVIVPSEVSPVWGQGALALARGGMQMLPAWAQAAAAMPSLHRELEKAARAGAEALGEYAAWLESDVLPHAQGDFAVGKELFDEILREDHMVDYDSSELQELLWEAWNDLDGQLEDLAREVDPSKSVAEVFQDAEQDHPEPEGLLDAYREKINAARQFVIDRDLLTIPEGESLRVEATPELMRAAVPQAALLVPYFIGGLQEATFIVTPAPANGDAAAVEEHMVRHHWASLAMKSIYETYPGHRIQLAVGTTLDSLPRQLGRYLSPSPFGGWAYCAEEIMENEGFLKTTFERMTRRLFQRERCSLALIDVGLHTGKMSLEEAGQFLVGRARLRTDNLNFQIGMALKDPGERQSFYTGYLQLRQLIDDYKAARPEANSREIHDAILNCGLIPPKLMRETLLGPLTA